jgi:hypothetical protein
MHDVHIMRQTFDVLKPFMSERMRRWWAAAEAMALGRGGVAAVATATGLGRRPMTTGMAEPRQPTRGTAAAISRGSRRPGGGRQPVTHIDAPRLRALASLVDPVTRGEPQSPRRWPCQRTRTRAGALNARGHRGGERTIARLLQDVG